MGRAMVIVPMLMALLSQTVAAQREPTWRGTGGIGIQIRGGAGVVGRQPNATGEHEDLIARLDGGLALAVHAGIESRFGGGELRLSWGGSAVKVANVDGIRFPNHGEPAIVWTGNIMVYPIALITRTPRKLQPFIVCGVGGMLLQVDLDNLNGQTVYHRFQWTAGGGLRIVRGLESPMMTTTYIELRVERLTTWPGAPFQRFRMVGAAVALGMRY